MFRPFACLNHMAARIFGNGEVEGLRPPLLRQQLQYRQICSKPSSTPNINGRPVMTKLSRLLPLLLAFTLLILPGCAALSNSMEAYRNSYHA